MSIEGNLALWFLVGASLSGLGSAFLDSRGPVRGGSLEFFFPRGPPFLLSSLFSSPVSFSVCVWLGAFFAFYSSIGV